jgi:putative FmdB family regulatory protein
MPAYEYKCAECSHNFERRQKMSDPPVSACPECGGNVKRLISGGAGAISKGSLHSATDAGPACGLGGCCGQAGGCCGELGCEN